jgi:hypothetical protein
MTAEELITVVTQELKSLSSRLVEADYANAVQSALYDTGWTLPVTVSEKILWLKRRTKRHLIYMLLTESAAKFKFEQINLQHRFDHYWKLVEKEDADFAAAIAEDPWLFVDADPTQMFGHKIDAGFAYDDYGQDITYRTENEVIVTPGDAVAEDE